MKIEVNNWDEYNPRKDLKSMPWFRVESDIGTSEKLFSVPAEGRWLWIFILSTCAKKHSGKINLNIEFTSHQTGISTKKIKEYIQAFENIGLVTDLSNSDRSSSSSRSNPIGNVPNEHNEHNEHNEQNEQPVFDLEDIYKLYPRKEGKKKGIEKLTKTIKTQEDFERVKKAVINYSIKIERESIEAKFIKHFATWVNCWEDYELIQFSEMPSHGYINPFSQEMAQ